jgi:hypothetical protein
MVNGLGSVIVGTEKYWLLLCTKNALLAIGEGPEACGVGIDADVRDPSFPDTSPKKLLGLKG